MNTKITMAVLASVSLALAAILATPATTSPVFAGDDRDYDDDNGHHDDNDNGHGHKKCKLPNGGDFPGNGPGGKCPPGLDRD